MKLPNGYGSVYKLSGRRRNPWAARKTTGWTYDPEKGKSFPIYKFVGFYTTKRDALQALAEYNKDPYDMPDTLTLQELYDRWLQDHSEKVTEGTLKAIRNTWPTCRPLYDMAVKDLKLAHYQTLFDDCGKSQHSLFRLKCTLKMMYEYAARHEIIAGDKRNIISYIDLSKAPKGKEIIHRPFSTKEIDILWKTADYNLSYVLLLIYTGLRVGELLELKKEDVHIEERWLHIGRSKTQAGIRDVPIAEKIVPIFQTCLQSESSYVVSMPSGQPMRYNYFLLHYWKKVLSPLNMDHSPHDARYTCVSLLTAALVDDRVIRQIVGHRGNDVTENVYTHLDMATKLDAINKI